MKKQRGSKLIESWQQMRDRDVQERFRREGNKNSPLMMPPGMDGPSLRPPVLAPKEILPKTSGQAGYFKAIQNNSLTFCNGPAGTGKTLIACYMAARLLFEKKISKIFVSRPLVTCGEEMGFIPGDATAKVSPYITHIKDFFGKLLPNHQIQAQVDGGLIEFRPLAFMRGVTFEDCFVILDEAENATSKQIHMITTRIGENCKMVLCGDGGQSDIDDTGFEYSMELYRKDPPIDDYEAVFLGINDIVRSKLVKQIEQKWATRHEPAKKSAAPTYKPRKKNCES